ncbi:MAG: hypothetical protein E7214_14095 [Clostridium sp.]|nr:hypothetical protein [Clostridium sp.]
MSVIIREGDLKWGFPYYAPNDKKPSEYIYQIAYDYDMVESMNFYQYTFKIAEANQKHESGNIYACYSSWIGASTVWLIYPLKEKGDESKLLTHRKALKDIFADEGEEVFERFNSSLSNVNKKILKYAPELSNLVKDREEEIPFDFICYFEVDLKESYTNSIDDFSKVIKASNSKEENLKWITYVEEDNKKLHIYMPIRKFKELDLFKKLKEILSDYYDEVESSKIRNSIYEVIEKYKTSVMDFVPPCDNSGALELEH